MKWYFVSEDDLKKLGVTDFSKFEKNEPLAVWNEFDIKETIYNYLNDNYLIKEGEEGEEEKVVDKIYSKLKERNEEIFDYSDINEKIDQEINLIYKELYEINLNDIYIKDDKAFYVCTYGDYYGCEVYKYNNNKFEEFLYFTNLEEHMFEGMEKINLSLREKVKNMEGLGHQQFLCFKDIKDFGTRNFKQEIFYDVLDFLTDEELETLYEKKEVEPVDGPYRYIVMLRNPIEVSEEDIIREASVPLTILSETLGYFMSGKYSPEELKKSLVEDEVLNMLEKSKGEIDGYLEKKE